MTLEEIYNRIVYKVWANSSVPSGATDVMLGEFGLINNAHQKCQLEFNWWFQESFGTINTIAGQQSYTLFPDFKEIRTALFKRVDTERFLEPLSPLFKPIGESTQWQNANSTEYPNMFEIVDNAIVIYPKPSKDDRALHIIYWKLFPRLLNLTDSDPATENIHELIIELVCSEICDIRKEFDDSQIHRQRYMETLEFMMRKHNARINNYIKSVGSFL
jgi:hypothetical protein